VGGAGSVTTRVAVCYPTDLSREAMSVDVRRHAGRDSGRTRTCHGAVPALTAQAVLL
jgi:hypothetical protein